MMINQENHKLKCPTEEDKLHQQTREVSVILTYKIPKFVRQASPVIYQGCVVNPKTPDFFGVKNQPQNCIQ